MQWLVRAVTGGLGETFLPTKVRITPFQLLFVGLGNPESATTAPVQSLYCPSRLAVRVEVDETT